MLTFEQAQFFFDNGFLILPNLLEPGELAELRAASERIVTQALRGEANPPKDFMWGRVPGHEAAVLRRIEYMQAKDPAFLRLLAHPVLLDAVQKIVGEEFVPTFDSMVVKMPGAGVEVPWHRDGSEDNSLLFYDDPQSGRRFPSVNFDFYLDEANAQTGALWVVPGSNKHSANDAVRLREAGLYAEVPGAIRVDMQPGDVLLHDTTLFHGSPATHDSPSIRRVIYYEFRDARFIEARHRPGSGPAKPDHMTWPEEWTRARLALLQKALDMRTAHSGDAPFRAHPVESLRISSEEAARRPLRVAHPGWDT